MKSPLVTTPQAAKYLGGLKVNTMQNWRIRGVGPAYKKIGRLVRYSLDDLDAYINRQSRGGVSKDGK